jgi:two-component system KDP operon response regulator KdpE
MRATLLVVDNPRTAPQLTNMLARDYGVLIASDAESAMTHVHVSRPALIIAALELPLVDGIELCRRVRLISAIPIIVLSCHPDARSEVAALDAGANDCITRPFGADQLLARVRVALRRRADLPESPTLSLGDFCIDFREHRVRIHGQPVRLTPKEFDLFVFMARHPNRVLAHRTLIQAVWGPGFDDHAEYLRVFVGQLRKKLEDDPAKPCYIVTEPWIGYQFNPAGSMQQRPDHDRPEARDDASRSLPLVALERS